MTIQTWLKGIVAGGIMAVALTSPVAAQQTHKVSIASTTSGLLYTPIYAADVLGYFAEENIEIELQQMNSSAIMAAVIRGNVDIYPATAVGALRAASEGADVRIFGGLMTQYASNVVISGEKASALGLTEESTYEERLAALRGLNIAVTGAGSGTHQLALYLLGQGGFDPDRDATVVFAGGAREILAAFQHGRVDAFILSNPSSDTAVKDFGAFLLLDMGAGAVEALDGYPYITLNGRGAWLNENPERSTAFMRAITRALQAIRDPARTDEVRDKIHAAYLQQFDKELFDVAWANLNPAYPTDAVLTHEQILTAINFLNQFADQPFDPAVAEVVLIDDYAIRARDE